MEKEKMRNDGAQSINGGFVITDLIMLESGRYNDRFLRSLKIGKISYDTIDRLAEEILTTNGKTFRPGVIASIRSPVITLDPEVNRSDDLLEISRGFDQKRFCWIMKIEEMGAAAGHQAKRYTITGYTDRMEFSKFSRSIPDELEFYINSILEVNGSRKNNLQLFTEMNVQSSSKDLYMVRPSDVISKHAFINLSTSTRNRGSYHGDVITGKTFKTSSRQNNIPANYLAKTLTGLQKTRMELETDRLLRDRDEDIHNSFLSSGSRRTGSGRSNEIESEYEAARLAVHDSYAEDYEFIQMLKDEARQTQRVGSFNYRQLSKLVPDIGDFITLNLVRKDLTSIRGRNGDTNDRMGDMDGEAWGYSTQEELVATEVANAFSTVALSTFIANIDIMFTLNYDEMDEMEWDFAIGYEDDRGEQEGAVLFLDDVGEELEKELIDKLGYTMIDSVLNSYRSYGYDIFISVQYNMNRELFVRVAIDSDEAQEFCTPIFCDSITSPIVSNKSRTGLNLGSGITELYKQVYRAQKS